MDPFKVKVNSKVVLIIFTRQLNQFDHIFRGKSGNQYTPWHLDNLPLLVELTNKGE